MRNVRLPTVWNQIEAAMAYAQADCLFSFSSNMDCKYEGMLEERYDWRVKWVNLA